MAPVRSGGGLDKGDSERYSQGEGFEKYSYGEGRPPRENCRETLCGRISF